jgi:hypothetical protein
MCCPEKKDIPGKGLVCAKRSPKQEAKWLGTIMSSMWQELRLAAEDGGLGRKLLRAT